MNNHCFEGGKCNHELSLLWGRGGRDFSLFICSYLVCFLFFYSQNYYSSPWYNRHGWLGVKNQLSIYLRTINSFYAREKRRSFFFLYLAVSDVKSLLFWRKYLPLLHYMVALFNILWYVFIDVESNFKVAVLFVHCAFVEIYSKHFITRWMHLTNRWYAENRCLCFCSRGGHSRYFFFLFWSPSNCEWKTEYTVLVTDSGDCVYGRG